MIKGTGKVEATVGLTGAPKNPDDNYRFMSLKGSGGIVFGGSLGQVGNAGLYVMAINPGETRTWAGTPGGLRVPRRRINIHCHFQRPAGC